ncbi:MAG: Rieske 2Fe-2S domain-containing protein, partial [Gemmataceae bacterium]|nr:Rieske 2Fe-2S domain-containing protein [Gemmataceae bacterium]
MTHPVIRPDTRPDWHTLPGEFYSSDAVYAAELARIWRRAWLFAAHTCELAEPGAFITLSVGDDPILLLRDGDRFRAFHNVCPHRGTLLCAEERGKLGQRIVCHYHQWSFTRAGELASCRGMEPDVDRAGLNLRRVHVATAAGMIFVSLAETPPDFAPVRETLVAAHPHAFDRAKVAHEEEYRVGANWKLVWDNNRECYHCDAGHPQYIRANFDIAEADRETPESRAEVDRIVAASEAYWKSAGLACQHPRGGLARFPDPADPMEFPVSATRTVQSPGFQTESMDGQRVAPFMGSLASPEAGVLRLRGLPNFWAHASCDHAVFTRLLPAGKGGTQARVTWLVAG